MNTNLNDTAKTTRLAYLSIHALGTPLWTIYNLLPYILYKDLHATPLQITLVITLKPLVSLLAIYWGEAINQRPDRLRSNIVWARFLSLLPFFFFPFIDNPWYFIAAFGFYMLLHRGVVPAWMEVLKLNLPRDHISKTFAWGSLIGYCGNILSPFLIGWLLDDYFQAWRWLFPLTALISLSTVWISSKIPILTPEVRVFSPLGEPFLKRLCAPWKTAWKLLLDHKNFRKFQWGFMLGGGGLMLIQPVLPQYCVDVLQLNYKEMAVAFACFKGIGFVVTTPLWTRILAKIDIYRFASWPPFWVFLYSICLLSAQYHLAWVFVAYFCYGIMEGGSSLAWNLSGPIFAREADSSSFSNVNVLTVGVRGCFAPALGSALGLYLGSIPVIAFGGFLCLFASRTFIRYSQESRAEVPA